MESCFHLPHWLTGRYYPELLEEVGEWDAASPDAALSLSVSFLGIYFIDVLISVCRDVQYGGWCSLQYGLQLKSWTQSKFLSEGNWLRSTQWNTMQPPKNKVNFYILTSRSDQHVSFENKSTVYVVHCSFCWKQRQTCILVL